MKQRVGTLLACGILVSTAAVRPPASAQTDGDTAPSGGDVSASAGREDAAGPEGSAPDVQLTPAPPRYVPYGTDLRERLVTAREQLRIATDRKADAVQQGKTGEEIRALDAQVEEWQRKLAAVQSEMEIGNVPAQPLTPRPHTRAVPSTGP